MIDLDEIRKEVAFKHGILLDKDDPLLVTVTLNEEVLSRFVGILIEQNAAQNTAYLNILETAQQKGIADAKVTAGRVINDASDYVSVKIHSAVLESLTEGMAHIKKELFEIREEVIRARMRAVSAAALAVACSVVTLGLVIVAL